MNTVNDTTIINQVVISSFENEVSVSQPITRIVTVTTPGPKGDRGGAIPPDNIEFTNQDTIIVIHSLGYYPLVQIINNSGLVIIPTSITHNSLNQLTIVLAESTTGFVILR